MCVCMYVCVCVGGGGYMRMCEYMNTYDKISHFKFPKNECHVSVKSHISQKAQLGTRFKKNLTTNGRRKHNVKRIELRLRFVVRCFLKHVPTP